MTDELIHSIVRTTLAFGFAAGVQWMASDKPADSCAAAFNEVFEGNIEFITSLIRAHSAME